MYLKYTLLNNPFERKFLDVELRTLEVLRLFILTYRYQCGILRKSTVENFERLGCFDEDDKMGKADLQKCLKGTEY